MSSNPVALQLYTLRDIAKEDFLAPLKLASKVGYKAVEFAGHGGYSGKDLKNILDDLGLQAAGSHVSAEAIENDFDKLADEELEIGSRNWIVSSMPGAYKTGAEGFRRFGAKLTELGKKCKERGLSLSYHNHAYEFMTTDGVKPWDLLMESSDPQVVGAEVDTFWVEFAGDDPVRPITAAKGRCPFLHLKDMSKTNREADCEIGEGTLDWDAILKAGDEAGVQWLVVEQEHYTRSLEDSIRISLENLRKMGR